MTTYQWLLGLHVLAAFLFISGGAMVGLLHTAALRSERPSDVATLLGLSRTGVIAVVVGAVASLALGLALVAHLSYRSIGDTWVVLALLLWAASIGLGAVGGKHTRRTRYLADQLAHNGDVHSVELRRSLRSPASLVLNYSSFAAALAVLALMVWKP
jgi:uncharacterized membrane protein